MESSTARLWTEQDRHKGDRHRLFTAVGDAIQADTVLYPGSYVDVAASFVFPSVTYVDVDRRAERFFRDRQGVAEIIASSRADEGQADFSFIAADYRLDLGLEDESFDLLVSLYAGFISEHCTQYLRQGGYLLANPSHGDAAMASIDSRYRLVAVVQSRSGSYQVKDSGLDSYLVPKKPEPLTVERLHELGRGVAYTKSAFAYLFQRVS